MLHGQRPAADRVSPSGCARTIGVVLQEAASVETGERVDEPNGVSDRRLGVCRVGRSARLMSPPFVFLTCVRSFAYYVNIIPMPSVQDTATGGGMARLYSVYGLSRELGMSVVSLRRWLADGELPVRSRNGHRSDFFTVREVKDIRRAIVARRLGRSPSRSPERRRVH